MHSQRSFTTPLHQNTKETLPSRSRYCLGHTDISRQRVYKRMRNKECFFVIHLLHLQMAMSWLPQFSQTYLRTSVKILNVVVFNQR